MKLIFCPACHDVRKLDHEKVTCQCGMSHGFYTDRINAVIGGLAIPLGFNNTSLVKAIETRPESGMVSRFEAFVIPRVCPTIKGDS